jgi:hypothetical protein
MRTLVVSAALSLGLVAACGKPRDAVTDSTTVRDTAAVVAGTYTLDDFRRLRWLDGRWRGFMPDGKTFYEQYQVRDDSTIVKYGFADSTFMAATDTSLVQFRGGTVSNDGHDSRWVATRLDSTGVDFAPHHGATNHFTWAQESPTKWNATLRWTDNSGRPQSILYALHRFGR